MGAPRDARLTFSGAGQQELQYIGRHIRIRETPSGPVFITISGVPGEFERYAGEQINLPPGDAPFQRILVRSAVAQTVVLTFAENSQDDDRAAVNLSVSATITPADVLGAGGDVNVAATSSAQVIAGDANRLAVVIANPDGNAAPVRVGGSGVNATSGIELQPGDSITLATTAAVYVYNTHSSAQDVQVLPMTT